MNSIGLRLYGVVSEILPDGEISIGEPILTEQYGTENKFYGLLKKQNRKVEDKTYASCPIEVEEVDINQYEQLTFLPASHKKIRDGQKYLIVFQPTKDGTHKKYKNYLRYHNYLSICVDRETLKEKTDVPTRINVAIKFPNRFIVIVTKNEIKEPEEFRKYLG